jgi:hypothetical protein
LAPLFVLLDEAAIGRRMGKIPAEIHLPLIAAFHSLGRRQPFSSNGD